jgi:energy-coupling factor transport system ATP-binding protein
LRAEEVEYRYPAGVQALSGVSLGIRQGDFVAIVGANGSGKTTLVKNLNGLLRPTAGAVGLDGRDLAGRQVAELGKEIGFVFQNPDHQIFSPRVFDEVAFGPRNYGWKESEVQARVKKALFAVGLSGAEDRDPFLMTKGERQRLAVASILAPEPRVLILDEPTTGLDYPEQAAVMEMLQELNREGRTIIIVTHTLWLVARYARRAVLMAGGKILADGPTRQALGRSDLRQASLRTPEIMQMGMAFGFPTLTAEEFLRCLTPA